jgi:polyhydroxyalkanoate synthesis regulator phasin
MPRKARRTPKKSAVVAGRSVKAWRKSLSTAVDRVRTAEAKVERQVRSLVRKNRISSKDAAAFLSGLQGRVESERRRAFKTIDHGLKTLQARVRRESHAASRLAEETVRRTLAALNIPSRREILELTHKVDELSRKIGSLKRR